MDPPSPVHKPPLLNSSKKIKKTDTNILEILESPPQNESDKVQHFQPSTSSDMMFGKYLLNDHISDGTFGRVYAAVDRLTGRHCAIKVWFFSNVGGVFRAYFYL